MNDNKDKLNFVANDINNIIYLKNSLETNITTIVKYYSLVLTAFFGYVIFYISNKNIVYSLIGLVFVIFIVATTYYTTYAIIKNLKRRILYRREITGLRSIANDLTSELYKGKTICQLDHKKLAFTGFDNLPTIAIMIAIVAPIISFIFVPELVKKSGLAENAAYQVSISLCILLTIAVFEIILNLYTVHRKEIFVAEKVDQNKIEQQIIDQVSHINDKRRERKKYKRYKILSIVNGIILFGVFIFKIIYSHSFDLGKWDWYINSFEIAIAIIILSLLLKKNRFLNMKNFSFKKPENGKALEVSIEKLIKKCDR